MSIPREIAAFDAFCIAEVVSEAVSRIACGLRPDVLQAMQRILEDSGDIDSGSHRALQMLVENAAIAALDRVPLCQDTGSVWVLLEVGTGNPGLAVPADIFSQVDSAIRSAWTDNGLRNSMLKDALIERVNTGDNTPAFCELAFKNGFSGVRITVMLKGGGSDNASRVVMLAPSDGWSAIKESVILTIREKGANACPPLIIGVGVGATFDKVAGLAKLALLRTVDERNPNQQLAAYEEELLSEINQLNIGAGAMGGQLTALKVNIMTAPSHMASLPVAVNVGCSAMRSITFDLTGEWLS